MADGDEAVTASRRDVGGVVAAAVSLAATLVVILAARQRVSFYGDDYVAFYGVVTQPVRQFLLTPVDVHFIPLHKLATWSIYRIAPLNFDLALAVMAAFHLLGLCMLYRTLMLLGASRLSAPLTAWCAVNVYAGVLLMDWSSGIARFAYVLLSIAAIHHYLRFRETGSWRRFAVVVACVVGAAAFFSKGLLIPGYLGAVELALVPETSRPQIARNLAAVALTGAAAVAYRLVSLHFIAARFTSPPVDWGDQLVALQLAATLLAQGALGVLPAERWPTVNWLMVALWGALLVVTVARDRFNAVVWLLLLVILAVNTLTITLSPRMKLGPIVVTVERYYFELLFLVALFLAIAIRRASARAAGATSRPGGAVVAVAWLAVAVCAWTSGQSFHRLVDSPPYRGLQHARTYAANLKVGFADIRRRQAGTLEFADGRVPDDVVGLAALRVGWLSRFLLVFDPGVRVSKENACGYVVREDGTIARPPAGCPA